MNFVGYSGAAIFFAPTVTATTGTANLTLTACFFTNNMIVVQSATIGPAGANGGALYAVATLVSVQQSQFINNGILLQASPAFNAVDMRYGGAACLLTSFAVIQQCEFIQNSAATGGAVAYDGVLQLSESTFINNVATAVVNTAAGGAVARMPLASSPVSATVTQCAFIGNQVSGNAAFGGALSVTGCLTFTITASQFVNNGAAAGGLNTVNAQEVLCTSTRRLSRRARSPTASSLGTLPQLCPTLTVHSTAYGGAVAVWDSKPFSTPVYTLFNCSFLNNSVVATSVETSLSTGGALSYSGGQFGLTLNINNCTFVMNTGMGDNEMNGAAVGLWPLSSPFAFLIPTVNVLGCSFNSNSLHPY